MQRFDTNNQSAVFMLIPLCFIKENRITGKTNLLRVFLPIRFAAKMHQTFGCGKDMNIHKNIITGNYWTMIIYGKLNSRRCSLSAFCAVRHESHCLVKDGCAHTPMKGSGNISHPGKCFAAK